MQRISCTVRFHAGGCCIVPLSVLSSYPPLRVLRKLKNTQTTSAKETLSTIRKEINVDVKVANQNWHPTAFIPFWTDLMNTDMNTMSEIKYKDQKRHTRFSTFIDHDVDEDLDACRLLFAATQSRNHNDMATEICFISRHANSSQFSDHTGSNLIWVGLSSSK